MAETMLAHSAHRSPHGAAGARGEAKDGQELSRWWSWAACRESPTALFFPVGNPSSAREEERAKALCASCPVRARCLALAVEQGERYGVWGGLNAEERRVLSGAHRPTGGTDA